jgi:hypothetical protein
MLESGLSGSVRGVLSNGHLYRDPGPVAEVVGFRGERHKPSYCSVSPLDTDDYLRPVEPLIAIVLGCMRGEKRTGS